MAEITIINYDDKMCKNEDDEEIFYYLLMMLMMVVVDDDTFKIFSSKCKSFCLIFSFVFYITKLLLSDFISK